MAHNQFLLLIYDFALPLDVLYNSIIKVATSNVGYASVISAL